MRPAKPFRFATQFFDPETPAALAETARRAEDLGYSTFHLADHYLGPGKAATESRHRVQTVAAIPAMMAAAAATSSIAIGTRVLCVDYHLPVVLAKELATIEWLSGGRLEPGFGAGWIDAEYDAMGLTMERPGARIARLGETVELVRDAFAGSELNHFGEHVTAHSMEAVPQSPRPNGPSIMVGGGGRKVLGMAARLADIVSINFDNSSGRLGAEGFATGSADATEEKLAWIREAAGPRFDQLELEVGAYFVCVTDAAHHAVEDLASRTGLPAAELKTQPHTLVGSVESICETLRERRELTGISYITVSASHLEAFAPVVAQLSGT